MSDQQPFWRQRLVIPVVLLVAVAIGVLQLQSAKVPRSGGALLPRGVSTDLMRAARRGDVAMAQEALRQTKDVNVLDADKLGAIHHALHGRHVQMLGSVQAGSLRGQHEVVAAMIMAAPGFDAALRCPMYYSVQFRNMAVLARLLQQMSPADWFDCVTMSDLHNETLLFAAARSSASGFARLFINAHKSLVDSDMVPNYMRLLDVRPPTVVRGGHFGFVAMTEAIGHADATMIIANSSLISFVSNSTGYNGNTPLHAAAAGGRLALLTQWMNQGADFSVRNNFGQTPQLVACANGFREVVQAIDAKRAVNADADVWGRSCADYARLHSQAALAESAPELVPQPSDTVGITGGWGPDWTVSDLALDALSGGKGQCTVIERGPSLSAADFTRDFLALKRPVMIRGLAASLADDAAMDKEPFLKQFGAVSVQVGPVPYADTYGVARPASMNISAFVAASANPESVAAPAYVFDAQVLWREPTLRASLPVPAMFENFPLILSQFMMGPRGSGHAVNALIHGAKRWVLFPPREAFFTARHVLDWLEHDGPADLNLPGTIECVQLPGDVIFVPEFWGHAVVNLRESMAVAYEFHE